MTLVRGWTWPRDPRAPVPLSSLLDDIGQHKTQVVDSVPTFFKIINTDNFDGDYPNEKFIENLPPHLTEAQATRICDAIMEAVRSPEGSCRFWRIVPEGYVLRPGFSP